MTGVSGNMPPWPKGLKSRMSKVREAAGRFYGEPYSAAVVERPDGKWVVMSLDQRKYPDPWFVADSLEALERRFLG